MEANEIINYIFGDHLVLSPQTQSKSDSSNLHRTGTLLANVNNWVEDALSELSAQSESSSAHCDKREGRLGPNTVYFDVASHVGLFVLGSDRLSINSQSNFSTICANVCLFKGKWQYEVQLGSKGVMQIGWATNSCKFTQETGVGDTINSYAYDGNRVRKWNVSTYKYGEPWLSGDVIGCTIDLDEGEVEFYRNGHSMGKAFDDIKLGPGMAYFPAVSLAFTENLIANFGCTPFRYPVDGFEPIQEPPYGELAKANLLFKWLFQLLSVYDQNCEFTGQHSVSSTEDSVSNQTLLAGVTGLLMAPLAPLLLSPYIIEACFIPFLEVLCDMSSDSVYKEKSTTIRKQKYITFMDILWTFLEEFEIKKCFECVVSCLLGYFRHVSFGLDYGLQKKSLILLTHLVKHKQTRRYLLQCVLFDKVRFASFVHVKPLDEGGLVELIKKPWWESSSPDDALEKNKDDYMKACQKIKEAAGSLEALQVNFLGKLLDNKDGSETEPSSRKIFLKKFRVFLHENLVSSQTLPLLQTPLPVSLCCFHRLLVTFRILWDKEVGSSDVIIPSHIFYDGSINYFSIDRLGGLLSHLNKSFRSDLIAVLGEDHRVVTSTPRNGSEQPGNSETENQSGPRTAASLMARLSEGNPNYTIPVLARMLTQHQTSSDATMLIERFPAFFSRPQDKFYSSSGPGNADPMVSLIELLDGLVMFYHLGAHKQLVKVSTLREHMTEYASALNDTKVRLNSYNSQLNDEPSSSNGNEVTEELKKSCKVFENKLSEQARHMAWVRGAVYSADKQGHLVWFFKVVLNTVKQASSEGNLFAFLPEFYIDTLVEVCTALRAYMHPTVSLENVEGSDELLIDMAEFLCEHFADARIVNSSSKDTLIQALASFVCHPNTLLCLERSKLSSQKNMVKTLLRPYENRAWAQSNWILVRIWHGSGFAFRYQKSPHLNRKIGPKMIPTDSGLISQTIKPCPSETFQSHVRNIMLDNEQLSIAFLNSLLNQLNWAFSEFIGMLQEIQNLSNRPQRVYIESRQLKICATCFDLTLSLLRVLEMIASVAREIFTDPKKQSSELLLSRLCQLLCQVLNRISSQAGCFQHVVILEIPDLETVDHFPILAAVIGILLALLDEEMEEFDDLNEGVPKVSKCLLSEPSFQMDSLHFVMGDNQKGSQFLDPKPFSFQNYEGDVTPEELDRVRKMIDMLNYYHNQLSETKIVSDDEVCTICYAYPISATFKPCGHQSCRSCIAHHLMNNRNCFFCKTPIDIVIGNDGEKLHDLTTNEVAMETS